MPIPDWYAEQLRREIQHLRETVAPLEQGKVRLGDATGDITAQCIERFRGYITEIEDILESGNA